MSISFSYSKHGKGKKWFIQLMLTYFLQEGRQHNLGFVENKVLDAVEFFISSSKKGASGNYFSAQSITPIDYLSYQILLYQHGT